MIEAFVVLFVLTVSIAAYVWARVLAGNQTGSEDMERLRRHQAELAERLEKGRAQQWDAVMLGHVSEQLADVDARLAKAMAR